LVLIVSSDILLVAPGNPRVRARGGMG